jgi:hypothetical protein
MGLNMIWTWTVVKKSNKSPFIRIPKDVLEKMETNGKPLVLRVLMVSMEEEEKIRRCLEGG